MRILDIEQNTIEWHEARAGKITGTKAKKAQSTDYKSLIYELISEIETGIDEEEGYLSSAMIWGTEQEPLAREHYENITGRKLNQAGLLLNDYHDLIAISPDGWSEDENGIRGVEFKCPNTPKHIMIIDQNKIGSSRDYWENQVFHWFQIDPRVYAVDFMSYDVRFQKRKSHIITVHRQDYLSRIESETKRLMKIKTELELTLNKVTF